MRVALLSDIHGHLLALEAVLSDLGRRRVDQIICLGDTTLCGPQPSACAERIRALGSPTVQGNCDASALRLRAEGPTAELMGAYARFGAWVSEIDLWSAQALNDADATWLAALPLTITLPLDDAGVTLLCAHGSPQSFNHRLTPDTPNEQLAELVGPVEARVLACGHTHLPMARRLGDLTIINPGSIGLPIARADSGAIYNPIDRTEYGIIEYAAGALRWELRQVALDADAVRAAARASGMPHADRWGSDWTQA
ncbi:MAG TPA: metallophosphoesterase family protein [Ktedonobacterales bacterium]|nr:metallophosphoesterase family protein [Ktedonobacterales bacterium]